MVRTLHPRVQECTRGSQLLLTLTLTPEGRIGSVQGNEGGTDLQRDCIRGALARIDLPGIAAQRQVRVAVGGTSTYPPSSEPVAPPETAIRARIDASARRVLACTNADALAVEVAWSSPGQVTFGVLGGSDPATVECIAAAIGVVEVPPGAAPGRLVHSLAR